MGKRIQLLIIDPQVDFCRPGFNPLYVPGADQDMVRLAEMITRNADKISGIKVTLDSHHIISIWHPIFWIDADGNHPKWFTVITLNDVINGIWRPYTPRAMKYVREYLAALERNKRYPLCIWPPHCLIGEDGSLVYESLRPALKTWTEATMNNVTYVTKGSNPLTEHYSAVVAEVPDPKDPSTQLNTTIVDIADDADIVLFAGQASTHCVANTGRDLMANFKDKSFTEKFVFLKDASSPVPGFESLADAFFNDAANAGMKFDTTTSFFK